MKKFKGLFATAAAAAMLTATTAAAAPQTAPVRAAAAQENASGIGAEVPFSTIINIGILGALVVIVLLATRGGKDKGSPASP
jgi:hypothetical protein